METPLEFQCTYKSNPFPILFINELSCIDAVANCGTDVTDCELNKEHLGSPALAHSLLPE
jgi:hypothetical protein